MPVSVVLVLAAVLLPVPMSMTVSRPRTSRWSTTTSWPRAWQELCALRPGALVLDESHYCKNAAAKRTQAVQRLSAVVPEDGLVLALSGTPVTNRPAELISQLRILGRLEDFGSGARFGQRFRGPDAHLRLHWHLRARCFVRRLKADVLPQLPAKTRAIVPVELDNETEYRLAERDLVAWLRSQPLDLRELDAKVAAALRAERLVRCNALKLLAARGKLHAALAWIHDFCSSGERLVVFAGHHEVQRAVLARFPTALHILGDDSPAARDAALQAFQAPEAHEENQLIVCSIEVAGHGLTLTRASSVAFLELDWTPAKHDQAEDRCHRIGQQDAVNAYYLLAASTIDETISTLLERKRAVIGAVTDGREEDEERRPRRARARAARHALPAPAGGRLTLGVEFEHVHDFAVVFDRPGFAFGELGFERLRALGEGLPAGALILLELRGHEPERHPRTFELADERHGARRQCVEAVGAPRLDFAAEVRSGEARGSSSGHPRRSAPRSSARGCSSSGLQRHGCRR